MKRYLKFLVYWIANILVLYLASLFLPTGVTVGNNIFAPYQALVFNGFVLSLVIWYLEPVTKDLEIPMKNNTVMMLTYLAVNFATLWFIARFSFMTGIGLSSYWVVLAIAVFTNLVQYLLWKYLDSKK